MVRAARLPRRAFTLVELLVVIGIIAVLIGILLPVISRARQQANTTACMATMRNLGQLVAAYAVEFKGSVPYSYYVAKGTGSQIVGEQDGDDTDRITYVWWSVLRKFMRRGVGSNFDNSTLNNDGTRGTRFMPAFNCAAGQNRDAGCDFGSNMVVMPNLPLEKNPSVPVQRQLLRPAQLGKLPSDVILLWDATELVAVDPPFSRQYVCGYDVDGGQFSNPATKPFNRFRGLLPAGLAASSDEFPIDPGANRDDQAAGSYGNIRWRHGQNQVANFLFADGSVKSMGITKDFGTPGVRGDVLRRNLRPRPPVGYK